MYTIIIDSHLHEHQPVTNNIEERRMEHHIFFNAGIVIIMRILTIIQVYTITQGINHHRIIARINVYRMKETRATSMKVKP